MKKKLQVFVSSTYTDMHAERQAVVEAILRAGHIPAGMELFAAGDESQLETIHRWIEDSDVFMLILGGRYGSIEPKSGKSYIELEYEYALKHEKPLFAAVIEKSYLDAKIKEQGQGATERENGLLLDEFRERVTKKTCRFFGDPKDLKVIVFESIGDIERRHDLPGWIHGSDVVDPKATLEEMERLQKENVELRARVAEQEALLGPVASLETVVASLSEDEKVMLMAANNTQIRDYSNNGGMILVDPREFVVEDSARSRARSIARWRGVIQHLVEIGLIGYMQEVRGGTYWDVTHRGYEVIDIIAASGWQESPASTAG